MNETELLTLKKINLEIVKAFDNFCRSNDIKYWMDGGTLLGAIRHNGFIPWDDDIDIGMLRKDYNKFLQKFNNENGCFIFHTWQYDENYPHPFGKFGLKGSVLLEKDTPTKFEQMISIDIFPFDNAPSGFFAQKFQKYITKSLKILLYKKDGYNFNFEKKRVVGKILLIIINFINYFTNKKSLIKYLEYFSRKYNKTNTGLVFSVGTNYNYEDKLFPYKLVTELIELPFEDLILYGPMDWDHYLNQMLNNYMDLPPEDKQVSHHDFIKFEVGKNFSKLFEKD